MIAGCYIESSREPPYHEDAAERQNSAGAISLTARRARRAATKDRRITVASLLPGIQRDIVASRPHRNREPRDQR